MDAHLKELLEKIKDQGVKEADARAQEIVADAQSRADAIVEQAQAQADRLRKEAEDAAGRFEASARQAVEQAGRDLLLRLQASITAIFDALIRRRTAEALDKELLQRIIEKLVTAWVNEGKSEFTVLLSPKDQEACSSYFETEFADELRRGVEIKPLPGLSAGFRIGERDGSAYYDFTDQGLSELLAEFLNPRVAECIRKAADEESS